MRKDENTFMSIISAAKHREKPFLFIIGKSARSTCNLSQGHWKRLLLGQNPRSNVGTLYWRQCSELAHHFANHELLLTFSAYAFWDFSVLTEVFFSAARFSYDEKKGGHV